MVNIHKFLFFVSCLLIGFNSSAQESTRSSNPNEGVTNISGKILLIPFEPKLYMSEIDRKINQETNWNFEEIRENFRHQLDAEIKTKLSKIAPVVSFYADSLKMAKDLFYVYKSSSLSYDLIDHSAPEPANQKGIKNGQIAVEINTDQKFMNKKLNDVALIPYLNKKYNCTYFVFINELDIKNDMGTYDIASDTYQRNISVHYSIINSDSKTLASGILNSQFSSKINTPKRIVSQGFGPIAASLATILSSQLVSK